MRFRRLRRGLALLAALALCLPAALAEELGEMDLYDPEIYIEDGQPEEAPQAPDEGEWPSDEAEDAILEYDETPTAEPADTPADVPTEAPTETPAGTPSDAPTETPTADPTGTPADAPTAQPTADPTETPSDAPTAEPTEAPTPEPTEEVDPEPTEEPTPEPTEEADPEPTEEADPEPTEEPLLADEDAEIAAAAADLRMGLGEQVPLDGAALLRGAKPTGYASDKPEIVSVDAATGVLTGKALGMAVITVTGGGATVNYSVAVLAAPDKLVFPATALELGKKETRAFPATAPANMGAARIAYASSKPKVLAVDAAGNLVAKKTGTVTLTATAYNGAKATCVVRVVKAPSRVKLPARTAVLSLNESRKLTATLPRKAASVLTWTSDKPGIVSVDAAGNMTGLAPGLAVVTVQTFNRKRASIKVTVLDGNAPTTLNLNATELTLGRKEKFQLTASVGPGEAAVYTYATSSRRIAAVSKTGRITAKKAGTATITVMTQNGVTASVKVKVGKAPKKVALSPANLSLTEGQTGQLSAVLPSGAASTLLWESSDPSVAKVSASGLVTAVKPGKAVIRITTFNRKTAECQVVVSGVAGESMDLPEPEAGAPTNPTAAQMAANLRKSGALGAKRDAIANVVQLLISNGFDPAFAAGVGANIYAEGTYGLFESSKYITNYQKRPKYFCYLDGGNYYSLVNGKYQVTAVYLSREELDAYTGKATKMLRFGEENFYLNNLSGKYVQNVDLNQLEALMDKLAEGKWQGKFGLGIVQWTGARTKTLVSFYRRHAGSGNRISAAQVVAAENEMILYDLRGSYAGVYTSWKNANGAKRNTEAAARSAGSLVCLKYEIPANKQSKAVTRGNKAAEIYRIMVGN